MSLARLFRITEGITLQVRVEFENVFNRAYLANPTTGNARATQTKDSNGTVVSGFGLSHDGFPAEPGSVHCAAALLVIL
jgi:hypothetical protein